MGVDVVCPYCGKIIRTSLKDDEEIGLSWCYKCNRNFVTKTTITVTAVGLKIEGEEKKENRP